VVGATLIVVDDGPRRPEGPTRRTLLPDARGVERFLRVSWHPDARQFVISTWVGEECVGTVRLVADAAAELVTVLSQGLADSAGVGHVGAA
jgi:hypothetical protein